MRAIVIGDLHLDALYKYFPQDHLKLQANEISKAFNYGYKNGINVVVFLGDIGEHSKLSYPALCMFIELLNKYRDFEIHIILGNHDFDEVGVHSLQPIHTMATLGLLPHVNIYPVREVKKIQGIKFNFCSYPSTEAEKNAINFGHFSTPGSIMDNGHITPEDQGTKVREKDIWVLGHLHTPHGNFCGTMYQLSFPERLPKGFTVLEARNKNGKLRCKREFVQTDPAFKFVTLDIQSKSDLKKIDPNPLYLHRLVVKSKYELPEDIMDKYPNVVRVLGYTNKKEKKLILNDDDISTTTQLIEFPDKRKLLREIFKEEGMRKKDFIRGLELIKIANKV